MKVTKGIPINALPKACLERNPQLFRQTHPAVAIKEKDIIKAVEHIHQSPLQRSFEATWKLCDGPELKREHRFHATRKWRIDYYHEATKTAIELEGGIFMKKSGHSSIDGIMRDIEKYNEMSFMGITLFRLHAKNISNFSIHRIIQFIKKGL